MEKKVYNLLFVIGFIIHFGSMQAQTTVADGNWSSPMTWGGAPPMGTGTVVINHNVTLDMDYSHTSGSVTINSTGSVTGNSPLRVFALNYPSGTSSLTVDGQMNVDRVVLAAGIVTVNGTVEGDSLANYSILTINSGALFSLDHFMTGASGVFINDGNVESVNYLNLGDQSNSGTIEVNDFLNCSSFTNDSTAVLKIIHDFLNSDTLGGPAVLSNDGLISVGNDWKNDQTVDGSGQFCIVNNTLNEGMMTGTFDFCDLSGGNIDANTGTISHTITFCQNSCGTVVVEDLIVPLVSVFPVPVTGLCNIQSDIEILTVEILGITGKVIEKFSPEAMNISLDMSSYPSGVYIIRCIDMMQNTHITKLTVQ